MASFAAPEDLAVLLGQTFTQAQRARAAQLLAGATARIRAITDQWISHVADDVFTTSAPVSRVLWLPQRPVASVASVLVDGEPVTDWVLRGSRLIRSCPWSTGCGDVELEVTYTHGYPVDDERLDLAKDACMAMAAARLQNPNAYKSESIDDYSRTFAADDTEWAGLGRLLRQQYGRRPRTGSVNTAA